MKSYYAGMMGVDFSEARKKLMNKRFKPSGRHTHNALDDASEQAEIFEKFLDCNKVGFPQTKDNRKPEEKRLIIRHTLKE